MGCLPFTWDVRLALLHTTTALLGAHILNCLVLKHPFHIVSPSPWPILASASSLLLVFGLVQLVAVQRFFLSRPRAWSACLGNWALVFLNRGRVNILRTSYVGRATRASSWLSSLYHL